MSPTGLKLCLPWELRQLSWDHEVQQPLDLFLTHLRSFSRPSLFPILGPSERHALAPDCSNETICTFCLDREIILDMPLQPLKERIFFLDPHVKSLLPLRRPLLRWLDAFPTVEQ